MRHYDNNSGGKAMGAGLAGVAIGAALTYYLYGTDSGANKRKEIGKMASRIKNRSIEAAGEVGSAVNEVYESLTETVREKYQDFKDMDKQEIKDLGNRIREHIAEIKDDISETVGRNKQS